MHIHILCLNHTTFHIVNERYPSDIDIQSLQYHMIHGNIWIQHIVMDTFVIDSSSSTLPCVWVWLMSSTFPTHLYIWAVLVPRQSLIF